MIDYLTEAEDFLSEDIKNKNFTSKYEGDHTQCSLEQKGTPNGVVITGNIKLKTSLFGDAPSKAALDSFARKIVEFIEKEIDEENI